MKLGKAEAFRMLHHHQAGIRHIHAHLNNSSRNQKLHPVFIKILHDLLLLGALHPAMHQAHGQAAENAIAQFVIDFLRRRQLTFLAHFHQRADHIGLPPLLQLGAHIVINQGTPLRRAHKGADGLAPRRQLPYQGYIKVAVYGQGHRARDGRCGHDQHIRYRRGRFIHRDGKVTVDRCF